jgi:hypothetical protein
MLEFPLKILEGTEQRLREMGTLYQNKHKVGRTEEESNKIENIARIKKISKTNKSLARLIKIKEDTN